MDKSLTVTVTLRQALALVAALLEMGLSRHRNNPELEAAELALTSSIWDASKAAQDAGQATRSVNNDYQADSCI
jgi:hypothetical protein